MKLVDANLLLYAVDETSPHHRAAKRWLEERLSGAETVAFAWAVLLAFVRLATNPRVFELPLTLEEALEIVDSWLAQPQATVLDPTDRHSRLLRELLAPLGTAGNLTSDAHLAALAIEHGASSAPPTPTSPVFRAFARRTRSLGRREPDRGRGSSHAGLTLDERRHDVFRGDTRVDPRSDALQRSHMRFRGSCERDRKL